MKERTATCSCGGLRAICRGEPVRVSICHCLDCKRRTGSAFAYNATYPKDQVETSGASSSFTRSSEEGYWGRFDFCPSCGSTVFYEIERRPGMITVPAGAFADPGFPEPRAAVYGERRHPWLQVQTQAPLSEE